MDGNVVTELAEVLPEMALRAPLEEDLALVRVQAKHVPKLALPLVSHQVEPTHGLAALLSPVDLRAVLAAKDVPLAETRVLVVS